MTTHAWRGVWTRKGANEISLRGLLDASGYDSPYSGFTAKAWHDYVLRLAKRLGVKPGDSVYEVGCGAGAFLLPLAQMGCFVGGADLSPGLIEAAHAAIPKGKFAVGDAADPIPGAYDFVVSHGTFFYFQDQDYAAGAIQQMASATRRGIGVFDVPAMETRAESEAMRRGLLGEAEYAARYAGLEHQYYDPSFFYDRLPGAVECFQDWPDGYLNGKFRFHIVARS